MQASSLEKIVQLQKAPGNIRNICILAHVDHGKTTLADTLVASNGIISQRMAGKLRYLDSREDEQLRGITMKSSAISLRYSTDGEEYLVNLIDSPGHVDFSSEVSTAVRLCDGAVVLVDVVEGVCPQTHAVLRQAWLENIQPVLVLNKMDRLITELKMTPLEAHHHLTHMLQQINAVMGQLFAAHTMEKSAMKTSQTQPESPQVRSEDKVYDWSSGLEDTDDSELYFSPDQGNVIFASAIDGWGFGINHFAELYASKLGVNPTVLRKTLWGDFYLEGKTKKVRKGAQDKGKKPLFVQFVLENIWSVYETVLETKDKTKIEKIVASLKLRIPPRDARHADPRVHLQAICGQWLPLSAAVLSMVASQLPSPVQISADRVESLLCPPGKGFESLPDETQALKTDFLACSSASEAPVILFVSKLFVTQRKFLPQNKQKPLSQEELNIRREQARRRHAQKLLELNKTSAENGENDATKNSLTDSIEELNKENQPPEESVNDDFCASEADDVDPEEQVFVAFARVFSGTVRRGQKLYVLGPKHDPARALRQLLERGQVDVSSSIETLQKGCHITEFTPEELYLFMGRELEELGEIPAGNVLGLGGLEKHVLKSATLSNTVACPAFTEMHFEAAPIVRVAIEPKHPGDMSKLVRGMQLLSQADPCAEVYIQRTGENVLAAAGEVHLQKCLDDLKERYAKVAVTASAPIVPFRETLILPPKVDAVNEAITDLNQRMKVDEDTEPDEEVLPNKAVRVQTPNELCTLQVRACPLPPGVVPILEENAAIIKNLEQYFTARNSDRSDQSSLGKLNQDIMSKSFMELKGKLEAVFNDAGKKWRGVIDQVWAFGPNGNGPNILLNRVPGYERQSIWNCLEDASLRPFDNCIVSGFEMATKAGPLCQEPVLGVCFIVEDWVMDASLTRQRQQSGSAEAELSSASLETDFEDTDVSQQEASSDEEEDSECKNIKNGNMADQNADTLNNCDNLDESGTAESCDVNKSVRMEANSVIKPTVKRDVYGPFSGQLMSTTKYVCIKAFQQQPQRLMAAMYTCVIQATAEILGRMYAVLGKRGGRVLSDEMQEGSSLFNITAALPVVESFGFAEEIRKRTSGLASPQLKFSHWEILDIDPFWVPSTEEEYLHYGEKADNENTARKYMNSVRRRKGLKVDEKIVEFAEKQRTLTRNK